MRGKVGYAGLLVAACASIVCAEEAKPKHEDHHASVVKTGDLVPPCKPGARPFAGQDVTMLLLKSHNGGAISELKSACEAATSAKLNLVQLAHQDLYPNFLSDLTNSTGKYDALIAGAWWLGELVAGDYLLSMLATKEKSGVHAARGRDGIDPGWTCHFLPPDGSGRIDTYLKAGWNEVDVPDYTKAYANNFSNKLQFPYLRIPGAFSNWHAPDVRLAEAVAGQLTPEAALKAAAVDFEEITIRLGRDKQRRSYRASLGL